MCDVQNVFRSVLDVWPSAFLEAAARIGVEGALVGPGLNPVFSRTVPDRWG